MSSPVDEVLWSRFATAALEGMGNWIPLSASMSGDLNDPAAIKARALWAGAQADAMLAEFRKRYPVPKKWG